MHILVQLHWMTADVIYVTLAFDFSFNVGFVGFDFFFNQDFAFKLDEISFKVPISQEQFRAQLQNSQIISA